MFKFSILGGTNVQGKFKPEQRNTYTTILGDHKIDLSEADLSGDTGMPPQRIPLLKLELPVF